MEKRLHNSLCPLGKLALTVNFVLVYRSSLVTVAVHVIYRHLKQRILRLFRIDYVSLWSPSYMLLLVLRFDNRRKLLCLLVR
jgi:hypothetical protein